MQSFISLFIYLPTVVLPLYIYFIYYAQLHYKSYRRGKVSVGWVTRHGSRAVAAFYLVLILRWYCIVLLTTTARLDGSTRAAAIAIATAIAHLVQWKVEVAGGGDWRRRRTAGLELEEEQVPHPSTVPQHGTKIPSIQ